MKKLVEEFLNLTKVLTIIILEPFAKGYNKLPEPVRKGTGNFTSNIATLLSIPNHILQGNLKWQDMQLEVF